MGSVASWGVAKHPIKNLNLKLIFFKFYIQESSRFNSILQQFYLDYLKKNHALNWK